MSKKWNSEEAAKVKNVSTPSSAKKREELLNVFDVPVGEESSPTSTPCILQIRLLDGSVLKAQFQSDDLLSKVCEYLISKNISDEYKEGVCLTVNSFPKRTKHEGDSISTTTLEDAGLVPNGTLIVEKNAEKGYKQPEKPIDLKMYETVVSINPLKLKGESVESVEAFKKRQAEKDFKEKELDRKKKKEQLTKVRLQLAEREKERIEQAKSKTLLGASLVGLEQVNHSSAASSSASPAAAQPQKKEVTEVQVVVQLPSGERQTFVLKPNQTLHDLHQLLIQHGHVTAQDKFSFIEPPRREFKYDSWKKTTFASAQLIPRCALKIVLASQKGVLSKGNGMMESSGHGGNLPNPAQPFYNDDDDNDH